MFFTGSHDVTMDPKNRISIPAPFRSALDAESDGANFYVTPGKQETLLTTLYLFPEKYFPRFAEEQLKLQRPGRDQEDFEIIFYAHATLMEVDKQGRVILPQWAVDRAGLDKHVVLTGARNRLVLWDRDVHKKYMEEGWRRQADLKEKMLASAAVNPPASN
jgi:MraZ protein